MADPRAFLSFDFDNGETWKNRFIGQAKIDSSPPFTIHDWSSKTTLPQAHWGRLIRPELASMKWPLVAAAIQQLMREGKNA